MIQLLMTIAVIIVIAYSVYKLATVEWTEKSSPIIYLFPIYISLMILILIWL